MTTSPGTGKSSRAAKWITPIFDHPYKLILGAYGENQLAAFQIIEAIEGVANISWTFSNSSFNSLKQPVN